MHAFVEKHIYENKIYIKFIPGWLKTDWF